MSRYLYLYSGLVFFGLAAGLLYADEVSKENTCFRAVANGDRILLAKLFQHIAPLDTYMKENLGWFCKPKILIKLSKEMPGLHGQAHNEEKSVVLWRDLVELMEPTILPVVAHEVAHLMEDWYPQALSEAWADALAHFLVRSLTHRTLPAPSVGTPRWFFTALVQLLDHIGEEDLPRFLERLREERCSERMPHRRCSFDTLAKLIDEVKPSEQVTSLIKEMKNSAYYPLNLILRDKEVKGTQGVYSEGQLIHVGGLTPHPLERIKAVDDVQVHSVREVKEYVDKLLSSPTRKKDRVLLLVERPDPKRKQTRRKIPVQLMGNFALPVAFSPKEQIIKRKLEWGSLIYPSNIISAQNFADQVASFVATLRSDLSWNMVPVLNLYLAPGEKEQVEYRMRQQDMLVYVTKRSTFCQHGAVGLLTYHLLGGRILGAALGEISLPLIVPPAEAALQQMGCDPSVIFRWGFEKEAKDVITLEDVLKDLDPLPNVFRALFETDKEGYTRALGDIFMGALQHVKNEKVALTPEQAAQMVQDPKSRVACVLNKIGKTGQIATSAPDCM